MEPTAQARYQSVAGGILLLFCITLLSGCACLGSSAPPVEVYAPEYSSPAFAQQQPTADLIRVSKFTPTEALAVTTMIIRTAPNKRETYPNAWWTVHPGFLVTDSLIRDMRRSGLFRGVFSYRDDTDVRYVLGGTVEQFLEEDGEGAPAAVVVVNATLLDQASRKDPSKGVVFQKVFNERENMTVKSPQTLAAAMGVALERLSRAIQTNVYEAIQARPAEKTEK